MANSQTNLLIQLIDSFDVSLKERARVQEFKNKAMQLVSEGADPNTSGRFSSYTLLQALVLTNNEDENTEAIEKLLASNGDIIRTQGALGRTAFGSLLQECKNTEWSKDQFKKMALLLARNHADLTEAINRNNLIHLLILDNKNNQHLPEITELLEINKKIVYSSLIEILAASQCPIEYCRSIINLLIEKGVEYRAKGEITANTWLELLLLSNQDGSNTDLIKELFQSEDQLVLSTGYRELTPLQVLLYSFRFGTIWTTENFKTNAMLLVEQGAPFDISCPHFISGFSEDQAILNAFNCFALLNILVLTNTGNMNESEINRLLELKPDFIKGKIIKIREQSYCLSPLSTLIDHFVNRQCHLEDFKNTLRILIKKGANTQTKGLLTPYSLLEVLQLTNHEDTNSQYIREIFGPDAKVRKEEPQVTAATSSVPSNSTNQPKLPVVEGPQLSGLQPRPEEQEPVIDSDSEPVLYSESEPDEAPEPKPVENPRTELVENSESEQSEKSEEDQSNRPQPLRPVPTPSIQPERRPTHPNNPPTSFTKDINMMLLEGFIAVAGIATVALAFALLSAPTLYIVAGAGLGFALLGLGLFAYEYNQYENTSKKDSSSLAMNA